MIVNVMAPYRLNLHRLIAAGIPELKLHTLVTHGPADFDWKLDLPEAIHATHIGAPGDSPTASTFSRPVYEWRKGGRLIKYLKDNDIRAVIMLGYRHASYLRTIRYCGRTGLPLFIHNDSNIQGDRWLSRPKRWLKKRVYHWWLRRASGVMSMGEYGDQFFTYYGADPKRLYRVPLTPDYDCFAEVDVERLHQFREKFGLSAAKKYIIFSGRLVGYKRVDLLIDAFAALSAERPDWDLLIVGDGVLRDELRRRVPAGLADRVHWTGFLDGEEAKLAYHAADVLVLPTDWEAWALVIPEAMAAGLVVVSSHVPGAARELIEDGVSGRIFPAGDGDALKNAILQVTAADSLIDFQQRSKAALNRWRQKTDPVAEIRRALADAGVLCPPVLNERTTASNRSAGHIVTNN